MISCLDKALSVAEAWHTVFSLTDTSQCCACATHTQKHTCTSRRMESFSGQSSFCLRLRALLFAAIVFRHSQTYTTHIESQLHLPSDRSHCGKMPSFHYTYHFPTASVTQVKPALVVNLNVSVCVI